MVKCRVSPRTNASKQPLVIPTPGTGGGSTRQRAQNGRNAASAHAQMPVNNHWSYRPRAPGEGAPGRLALSHQIPPAGFAQQGYGSDPFNLSAGSHGRGRLPDYRLCINHRLVKSSKNG
jgi:hypothetical protein